MDRPARTGVGLGRQLLSPRTGKIITGVAVMGLTIAILLRISSSGPAPIDLPVESARNQLTTPTIDPALTDELIAPRLEPNSRPGAAETGIGQTLRKSTGDHEIPTREQVRQFFGEGTVTVLGYEVLAARLQMAQPLSNRSVERLDAEITWLLAAAREPNRNPQYLSREIARLDQQIDAVLTDALNHRAAPNSSAGTRLEVDRLEAQVDLVLSVTKPDSSNSPP